MKSCHYGSSCGHKQGKSVLSYPPGKHANLKTDFTAQLCGKTRLDATHFVQPPSCPKPTSTPTFPHHNNEKSKKMPHFLSFNPIIGQPHTGHDAVFTGTRQTQPTKIVTFPRNKAEKSPLQQHDLSILIVGPNQLKHRLSRTNKPKSHPSSNT